jgi:uncharacterized membrane protein YebE (DUF533 family)
MSFGSILGQLMEKGMGGSSPSRTRIDSAANGMSRGNLGGIFGELQKTLERSGVSTGGQGGQGLGDRAGQWLKTEQVGGLSGAHVGGIGAVAGALFGGGLKGAAQGGALAVLGTLAIGALRNSRSRQDLATANASGPQPSLPSPAEAEAAVTPAMERLALKAMIGAAKADGQIDQQELVVLFQKFGAETATADEKQFLLEELNKDVDIDALAAEVTSPVQAAEVYAASLLAIHVDTEAERQYLARLAQALGLDDATVAELHRMTGADA